MVTRGLRRSSRILRLLGLVPNQITISGVGGKGSMALALRRPLAPVVISAAYRALAIISLAAVSNSAREVPAGAVCPRAELIVTRLAVKTSTATKHNEMRKQLI